MTSPPREIDVTRVLCTLAELEETGSRGFAVGEGDWPLRGFVVTTPQGVAAFVNYCPHAGHPLNFRPHRFLTPDRALILCGSHGALFARDTGLCVLGPCAGQSLTKIAVEVIGGCVLLADGVDVEALANQPL
ncbi:MAG TPA: Rieske 2Fe-2S domain-containing protein [Steroidobacteraceae bacterium]|nr:Rieske 2Fe-2S domain-containing protein [Steroidobacteraceae bacterium]